MSEIDIIIKESDFGDIRIYIIKVTKPDEALEDLNIWQNGSILFLYLVFYAKNAIKVVIIFSN